MKRRSFVVIALGSALALGGCTSLFDDPSVPSAPEAEEVDPGIEAEPTDAPALTAGPTPTPTLSPTPSPTKSGKKKDRNDGTSPAGDDGKGADGSGGVVAAPGPSASRTDPRGDGDSGGHPPLYPDIRTASISGGEKALHLAIQVDTRIPRRLGRGINMTAHFRLDMPDGTEHQIRAIGDSSGWRADFDEGGFPGRFAVSGDIFVFEVPWRAVGGRSFRWFANTAWTREGAGVDGERNYYFDRVPELQAASFPE